MNQKSIFVALALPAVTGVIASMIRILVEINWPLFWWILPALCLILIIGVLGLFILRQSDRTSEADA
jgi:hypothetical protein